MIDLRTAAFILLVLLAIYYYINAKESLENINYDVGRATVMDALELTQPGQVGPTGHGDFIPKNLTKNIPYKVYDNDLAMLYDEGNKYIVQNGITGGFTEDQLRLNSLERSRFSPALIKQNGLV